MKKRQDEQTHLLAMEVTYGVLLKLDTCVL